MHEEVVPSHAAKVTADADRRLDFYVQIIAIGILVIGCFVVLRPFFGAILFSAVFCLSTWPIYARLTRWLRGRRSLAALCMALAPLVLVLVPIAVLAAAMASHAAEWIDALRRLIEEGLTEPPAWVKNLPAIGPHVDEYWIRLSESREELLAALKRLIEPASHVLFSTATMLGTGLLHVVLAAFVSFFFYRDGEPLVGALRTAFARIAGDMGEELLKLIGDTVRGVVYGILGTAIAQGAVATLGFAIAGVPAPFVLGAATFLLSLVPVGPPLVWLGAVIWLLYNGSTGWAVFMLLYGFFIISGIDNVVKPLLISRGNKMSMALIFLGVLGGIAAFGFLGIFLGPALLAVGFTIVHHWTQRAPAAAAAGANP